MPKKNDLSAFKSQAQQATATTSNILAQETRGRKKKSEGEKESETIALKVTPSELEYIKDKAGLVPLGTYIKHFLRNKTDLLG